MLKQAVTAPIIGRGRNGKREGVCRVPFFVSARWSSSFPVRECVRGLLLPPLREEGGEEGGKHRERKKKRLLIFGFPPLPMHSVSAREQAKAFMSCLSVIADILSYSSKRERERKGGGSFCPLYHSTNHFLHFFKKSCG